MKDVEYALVWFDRDGDGCSNRNEAPCRDARAVLAHPRVAAHLANASEDPRLPRGHTCSGLAVVDTGPVWGAEKVHPSFDHRSYLYAKYDGFRWALGVLYHDKDADLAAIGDKE